MPKILALLGCLALLLGAASCDNKGGTAPPKNKTLKKGGVYVAYNLGCDEGCDQIKKGDLIQKLDGATVQTAEDLKGITDGQSHKVEFIASATGETKSVDIKAKPRDNMPPLKDVPPFWLVSAEKLNKAPEWSRRRMFGHASPSIMLVSINGGILDGRQLFGKKRFVVYWDWGDREEEGAAIDFMQVLQKAQGDLTGKGVEIMFVHVRFPTGRKAAMNDSDLRAWRKKFSVPEDGGKAFDDVPMYRFPNETEFNEARELGMENAFTVFENLGSSPTIVLLDARGIVRWHSEGIQEPIGSEIKDPEQFTIITAVNFALEHL